MGKKGAEIELIMYLVMLHSERLRCTSTMHVHIPWRAQIGLTLIRLQPQHSDR